MDDDEAAAQSFKWLWTVALAAGCASLLLLVLYYWRNRDRSPFQDFAPSARSEPSPSSASPGADGAAGESLEPSEEDGA